MINYILCTEGGKTMCRMILPQQLDWVGLSQFDLIFGIITSLCCLLTPPRLVITSFFLSLVLLCIFQITNHYLSWVLRREHTYRQFLSFCYFTLYIWSHLVRSFVFKNKTQKKNPTSAGIKNSRHMCSTLVIAIPPLWSTSQQPVNPARHSAIWFGRLVAFDFCWLRWYSLILNSYE